jgi:hypothetical protein
MVAQSKNKGLHLGVLPWSVVLAALFLYSVPIRSQTQTVDEVEKPIASLLPDQRAGNVRPYWRNRALANPELTRRKLFPADDVLGFADDQQVIGVKCCRQHLIPYVALALMWCNMLVTPQ